MNKCIILLLCATACYAGFLPNILKPCGDWISFNFKPVWKCFKSENFMVETKACEEDSEADYTCGDLFIAQSHRDESLNEWIIDNETTAGDCSSEWGPTFEIRFWVRHTCTDDGKWTKFFKSEEYELKHTGESTLTVRNAFVGPYQLVDIKDGFPYECPAEHAPYC